MIYALLGPSGSGKSTLGRYLEELGIPEIKSHATRPMRKGESQGNPYHFVTPSEFAQIEMIEDTPYDGANMYGTSKDEVKRVFAISDTAYAILDKHGVYEFKEYFGADEVKVIYVILPEVELIERLKGRGDSPADIKKRMKHAKDSGELDNYFVADYVVVNRDLEESKRLLRFYVGVND